MSAAIIPTSNTSASAACHAPISVALSPARRFTAPACCKLINAYVENPHMSSWADIQDALTVALEAFGLPGTFIDGR
ncbi:hypothetical protein NKI04_24975 [Mesorhizobium sp. M0814]|uniref:hypothetical protein n=1 Tax=Mesorhizobium sp. M0814 TaxID=2957004 RepID=UPI00333BBBB2